MIWFTRGARSPTHNFLYEPDRALQRGETMCQSHKDQFTNTRTTGHRSRGASERASVSLCGVRRNQPVGDPLFRNRRRLRHYCILVAATLTIFGVGSAAAGEVGVVAPHSPGVLTKCRSWLMTTSCNTYHHITLPSRIAVGETITIHYGSSPKEYRFAVVRIVVRGDDCAIFNQADDNPQPTDNIYVARCH